MKFPLACCLLLVAGLFAFAGEIDDRTVVVPATPKRWLTFPLAQVRLTPGSPFYRAMTNSQQYLLDMDLNRMLARFRDPNAAPSGPYPGSDQPAGTRPGELGHFLSGTSLMYAQTGDPRLLERVNYLVEQLQQASAAGRGLQNRRQDEAFQKILAGQLELNKPDEAGYPWGGPGNFFYGVHKWHAGLRDAYLYCGNRAALDLWIAAAEPVTRFVLKANPDLFDDLLDIEHGGMNEVFADLYAVTGDRRYLEVSRKFNHQKVILNLADGKDVLDGRHANMQIPTFVGTARQFQLAGDPVSDLATRNFLDVVYRDHTTCIGGNSRYERFGRPGETTKRLGFTACETCNTYNLLKVSLQEFETSGSLRCLEYFERALYNHILASQDPDSGGVTYYTSLMPGGFKSYSKRFDLEGVWCCVGTGMENHSKYGEAIFFHNHKDVLVNLFIPATLTWPEKGLKLALATRFPEADLVNLTVLANGSFDQQIYVRYPTWVKAPVRAWINDQRVPVDAQPGGLIRLSAAWKTGDRIKLELPQGFRMEPAPDDPYAATLFHGPLALAGELGKDRLPPDGDLVRLAGKYRDWVPPTDDIPTLVADKVDLASWIQPAGDDPLHFLTHNAGQLEGKPRDVSLRPYFQTHHERYNLYWKLYSPAEFALRAKVVSDEINAASEADETRHHLAGDNLRRTTINDTRNFWEANRYSRAATNGGWFSYELKLVPNQPRQYLVVTYWGDSDRNCVFEVQAGGQWLKTEKLFQCHPLTYFEATYELPEALVTNRETIAVKFQAQPGQTAGPVFSLKITSDPARFPNYRFY